MNPDGLLPVSDGLLPVSDGLLPGWVRLAEEAVESFEVVAALGKDKVIEEHIAILLLIFQRFSGPPPLRSLSRTPHTHTHGCTRVQTENRFLKNEERIGGWGSVGWR